MGGLDEFLTAKPPSGSAAPAPLSAFMSAKTPAQGLPRDGDLMFPPSADVISKSIKDPFMAVNAGLPPVKPDPAAIVAPMFPSDTGNIAAPFLAAGLSDFVKGILNGSVASTSISEFQTAAIPTQTGDSFGHALFPEGETVDKPFYAAGAIELVGGLGSDKSAKPAKLSAFQSARMAGAEQSGGDRPSQRADGPGASVPEPVAGLNSRLSKFQELGSAAMPLARANPTVRPSAGKSFHSATIKAAPAAEPIFPPTPEKAAADAKRAAEQAALGVYALKPYEPLWRATVRTDGRVDSGLGHVRNNAREIEHYNNLGVRDVDTEYMTKGRSYVFFTCPDLKLAPEPGDKDDPGESQGKSIRNILSVLQGMNPAIVKEMGGNSGPDDPFIKILTNQAQGFTPRDIVMDVRDLKETFQGYKLMMPNHMVQTEAGGDFQVEYFELEDGDITRLHKLWTDYMSYVRRGFLSPKKVNVNNNILDYMVSAYHFVVGVDGLTIQYWAKYTGVFPTAVPYSSYSFGAGDGPGMVHLTVPYSYCYKEDMDLSILYDFAIMTNSVQRGTIPRNITRGLFDLVNSFRGSDGSIALPILDFKKMAAAVTGGIHTLLQEGLALAYKAVGSLQQEQAATRAQTNGQHAVGAAGARSSQGLAKLQSGRAGLLADTSINDTVKLEVIPASQSGSYRDRYVLRFSKRGSAPTAAPQQAVNTAAPQQGPPAPAPQQGPPAPSTFIGPPAP
jgi:hypothetical protein